MDDVRMDAVRVLQARISTGRAGCEAPERETLEVLEVESVDATRP